MEELLRFTLCLSIIMRRMEKSEDSPSVLAEIVTRKAKFRSFFIYNFLKKSFGICHRICYCKMLSYLLLQNVIVFVIAKCHFKNCY